MPMEIQQVIDALWDFGDPAASERRFGDAIANATSNLCALELRTQLARAQGLQRRFDEAHATLDQVQRDAATQPKESSNSTVHIRLLLERGRVFNSSGEVNHALPLFEQAYEAAQDIQNDHLAVDAAHMIAIVHGSQSRHEEAMTWNLRALELAASSTQSRARQWQASLHNNMAWTFHDQGRFTDALYHFECALQRRCEQNKPSERRTAQWCVARCLRSLDRIDDALAAQHALLQELQAANAEDDGFVHEEIGECLLALNRPHEAAPHFARAHALLSKNAWLAESQQQRLNRLATLGNARNSL